MHDVGFSSSAGGDTVAGLTQLLDKMAEAAATPMMELIPFSANIAGIAITAFRSR